MLEFNVICFFLYPGKAPVNIILLMEISVKYLSLLRVAGFDWFHYNEETEVLQS